MRRTRFRGTGAAPVQLAAQPRFSRSSALATDTIAAAGRTMPSRPRWKEPGNRMSIKQLTAAGTKVWSDSVEPKIISTALAKGITGATSNPIIIADIIKEGGLDDRIAQLIDQGSDDSAIAWKLNDELVTGAQKTFLPVWERTAGNDGYVSFELDPLLEDPEKPIPHDHRVRRYVELGLKYAKDQKNRMIKVPATEAGLACLEELAAHGVTLNVTL